MRAALEQVELIEMYLQQELTSDQMTDFESQMNSDPTLAEKVAAQEKVMGAIKRIGVKTAAISAYGAWKLRKWLMRGTLLILLLGGAYTTYHFATLDKEPDCVPCEEHVSETHGGDEAVFAYPDNCCDELIPVESSHDDTTMRTIPEEPSRTFGFEIVVDTGEGIMNSFELLDSENAEPIISEDEEIKDNTTNSENSNNNVQELMSLEREESVDIVYKTLSDNVSELDKEFWKNLRKGTYHPEDPYLDSMQYKDDIRNGNVTEEPAFPGGEPALQKYLANNMNYPEGAISRRVQGTVYVTFVIAKNGRIKNARVVRGVDRELDAEAVRIVRNMPKWVPGSFNAEKIDLQYTIPVQFVLTNSNQIEIE